MDQFYRRLARIGRAVPNYFPECRLVGVIISPHDHDRLTVALGDRPNKRHRASYELDGVKVSADLRVAEGVLQLVIERPTKRVTKLVSLQC